jgi:hypothetical protein
MTTVPFDRSTFGIHSASGHASAAPQVSRSQPLDMVEWEYSDAMRSSRWPAGWFLLPSAALGVLLLISLLH